MTAALASFEPLPSLAGLAIETHPALAFLASHLSAKGRAGKPPEFTPCRTTAHSPAPRALGAQQPQVLQDWHHAPSFDVAARAVQLRGSTAGHQSRGAEVAEHVKRVVDELHELAVEEEPEDDHAGDWHEGDDVPAVRKAKGVAAGAEVSSRSRLDHQREAGGSCVNSTPAGAA